MQNSLLSSLNLVKMDKLYNQDFPKPPNLKVGSKIFQALYDRSVGNYKTVPKELQVMAEEALIMKTHKESPCKLPDVPRSTFLMVFSPDGTKVASTHGNHNVYVTELTSKRNVRTLSGHPRTPWCIAFHPSSNQILASGCLGGQVRVWDLHGGSEIWMTESQTVIASLAFHPTDRLLVIASYNEVLFWDWSCPAPFAKSTTSNEKEKVRFVGFDPLGHKLLTGVANAPPRLESQWNRTPAPPAAPQPPPPPPEEPFQNDYERRIIVCYRFMVQQYEQLVHRYRLLIRRARSSNNSSIASSGVLGDSSLRRRTPPSSSSPRTLRRLRPGALPTRYTQYQLARVRPGVLRLSERSRTPGVLSTRVNRSSVVPNTVGQSSSDSRSGDGTMLQQFESEITESLARLHRNIRRMRIHMPWDSRDNSRTSGTNPLTMDSSDSEVDVETAPLPASPSSPHSARITIVPNPSDTSAWRQRDPYIESPTTPRFHARRINYENWNPDEIRTFSSAEETDELNLSSQNSNLPYRNPDELDIDSGSTNAPNASLRDSNEPGVLSQAASERSLSPQDEPNLSAREPNEPSTRTANDPLLTQDEPDSFAINELLSTHSMPAPGLFAWNVDEILSTGNEPGFSTAAPDVSNIPQRFASEDGERNSNLLNVPTRDPGDTFDDESLRGEEGSYARNIRNVEVARILQSVMASGLNTSLRANVVTGTSSVARPPTNSLSISVVSNESYNPSSDISGHALSTPLEQSEVSAGQTETTESSLGQSESRASVVNVMGVAREEDEDRRTEAVASRIYDPSNYLSEGEEPVEPTGPFLRATTFSIRQLFGNMQATYNIIASGITAISVNALNLLYNNHAHNPSFQSIIQLGQYLYQASIMCRARLLVLRAGQLERLWTQILRQLSRFAAYPSTSARSRRTQEAVQEFFQDIDRNGRLLEVCFGALADDSSQNYERNIFRDATPVNDYEDAMVRMRSVLVRHLHWIAFCLEQWSQPPFRNDASARHHLNAIASRTSVLRLGLLTLNIMSPRLSHVTIPAVVAVRNDFVDTIVQEVPHPITEEVLVSCIRRFASLSSRLDPVISREQRDMLTASIPSTLPPGLFPEDEESTMSGSELTGGSGARVTSSRDAPSRTNVGSSGSNAADFGLNRHLSGSSQPRFDASAVVRNMLRRSATNRYSSLSTRMNRRSSTRLGARPERERNSNVITLRLGRRNGLSLATRSRTIEGRPGEGRTAERRPSGFRMGARNVTIRVNRVSATSSSFESGRNTRNPANSGSNSNNSLDAGRNPSPRNPANYLTASSNERASLSIRPSGENLADSNNTGSARVNESPIGGNEPAIHTPTNASNNAQTSDGRVEGNSDSERNAVPASRSESSYRRPARRGRQTRTRLSYSTSLLSSTSDDDETPLLDDSDLDDDDDDDTSTSRPRPSSTSDFLKRLKALARIPSSETSSHRRPVDPNLPSTSSAQSPLSSENSSFSNIMRSVREFITQLETIVGPGDGSPSLSNTNSDLSPSHSRARNSDLPSSHSRTRNSDLSPSHSRPRNTDIYPSHSHTRNSDLSPSHSRMRNLSPSQSRTRNSDLSPSHSRTRNSDISPSHSRTRNLVLSPSHSRTGNSQPASNTSTPTSSSSSLSSSTTDGSSSSLSSLFSTPLSAFVSGIHRKRKQSSASPRGPESQRRHIETEPRNSLRDEEQPTTSRFDSNWSDSQNNSTPGFQPISSSNSNQSGSATELAESTNFEGASNEMNVEEAVPSAPSIETSLHADPLLTGIESTMNEPHVTSEAQTLSQSLLEGSSESIAILDDVLETVIEASEREGVPPLPRMVNARPTRDALPTPLPVSTSSEPISSTPFENVHFLRVPRARPWESWSRDTSPRRSSPSRRVSSPSRIGGVEMLRVPSSWSLTPLDETSGGSTRGITAGSEGIFPRRGREQRIQQDLRTGGTNSAVQTESGNSSNSGGGLYLLSRLMRPESSEAQSGDSFSYLGRSSSPAASRDPSPLRYTGSPVDMEIDPAPANDEVVISSVRERPNEFTPIRERESGDSQVDRLVTSYWNNSIRSEVLNPQPPRPTAPTPREGHNRLSDNPRFRSSDFQWSFLSSREAVRETDRATSISPRSDELSQRIQNLYQRMNFARSPTDVPLASVNTDTNAGWRNTSSMDTGSNNIRNTGSMNTESSANRRNTGSMDTESSAHIRNTGSMDTESNANRSTGSMDTESNANRRITGSMNTESNANRRSTGSMDTESNANRRITGIMDTESNANRTSTVSMNSESNIASRRNTPFRTGGSLGTGASTGSSAFTSRLFSNRSATSSQGARKRFTGTNATYTGSSSRSGTGRGEMGRNGTSRDGSDPSGSRPTPSSIGQRLLAVERRRMSERNATLAHERRLLTERRNLMLSERRSGISERLQGTERRLRGLMSERLEDNAERRRERMNASPLHRTLPGSSRTGVFREVRDSRGLRSDFRGLMGRLGSLSGTLDQTNTDNRLRQKLMNIAARSRLKRERAAPSGGPNTSQQLSTSRTPPGPPPASTLPSTSSSRVRTSRNSVGQTESDRNRMVKARNQARHILAMMLRHISSFFQNANLLDVPSQQDQQESFFFHERVYNLHRLLQLALHLTELLYAQLSRSRHLLDNLRSSLNSVTRLQSLLRHRQLSSRLLQVPSFRPSPRIRLSRESSVPLSVLSGSASGRHHSTGPAPINFQLANPPAAPPLAPRPESSEHFRDYLSSQQQASTPRSPDTSNPPNYSTPRFLHPRHHGNPPDSWDENMEETNRGGGLGSNVFLMRGAYGPNSILVPDSYYSPHHRIQAWDFARNNIPDIWNAQKNIVVKECKIHNDASVDISKDGQILVTLLPSGRLSVTTMLGVYSLHWSSLGQCLYTTSFELNAVSVSLSPTSRHLIVGLASRRVSLSSFADTHTIAQIFRLEGGVPGLEESSGPGGDGKAAPGGKKGRLVQLRHIELPRDTGYMSLNCIRWTPTPGQGLVYGTNTGLLRILE